MSINHSEAATFVIRHCVSPKHRDRYEQWLKDIGEVGKGSKGHLGVQVIRPPKGSGKCTYITTVRFDTEENLLTWANSDTRADHLKRIDDILLDGDNVEIHSGIAFWFTPQESHAQARPWKQFLVVLSAIYPLTIVVPWLLGPLFNILPEPGSFWLSKLIGSVCITGLMVYVIMPRYTRLVSSWLYR
ncbi:hypothetical protein [Salidesulfovibrio onnuriiensis]|uniref:hypothetical protein n=1 Tax=Salidesulfovibrio onnuriiensis TaxID=2583823 RepID=UPI0011C84283|nr:hypothetical protein [Salidesulfovibrio onnuriiensis]